MARGPGSWPTVAYERIDFKGGYDQLTPTLNLPPGFARNALNFEISITGGYTRILGYERFDGHPSPSANTSFLTMTLTALGVIATQVPIKGATSGTTAICCGTNPAVLGNLLAYTQVIGPGFQIGEQIEVGLVNQGAVVSLETPVTDPYSAAFFADEAGDSFRSAISAVPGQGSVRGVFYLNGKLYAFRDNVGATIENLYVSSGSGWTQVPYGFEVLYTGGTGTQPTVGQTLTGHTSGATGVIGAIINQTGAVVGGIPTWAPSTGRFILSGVTGLFQNGEQLWVSGAEVAVAGSSQLSIAPIPGGSYCIRVAAFGGSTSKQNVAYGASGVDRSFAFDPTPTTAFPAGTYIPIVTGSVPDTPTVIAQHLNYLVVGVQNSVQISALGLPFQWSALAGAAEILISENVSNIQTMPGNQATGALAIFAQDYTYILYGTSTANFQLVPYNIRSGAYFNTASNLADIYFFETRGITNLTTTLYYGNFEPSYLTMTIKPFIDLHQPNTTCSVINREKSQYRVFFNDGYGLYATVLNKAYQGCMPVAFPAPVISVAEGIDPASGNQNTYFGSSNGFVYQLDVGTSFDGQPILAYLELVFDAMKTHRMLKRFRKLSLEISGPSYAPLSLSYQVGYGIPLVGQPQVANYSMNFLQSAWDSFTWDSFIWDGITLAPIEMEIVGTAENIALFITSNTDVAQPFTINTATVHYTPRRGIR